MAKVLSLSQALKALIAMVVSGLLLFFGGELSDSLVTNPHASLSIRWLGVLVAVGSVIPWLLFLAWGVAMSDEYHRRVALVGTAIAFVTDILIHIAYGVMQDARIVGWNEHLLELPAAMGAWLAGVVIALLYYRFRP